MRHLILALMIVLLPLRSWAGDAMAMQMASAAVAVAIESVAAHAQKIDPAAAAVSQSQAVPDCHEAASGQLDRGESTSRETGNDHCGACLACQVCHTVALLPALLEVPPVLISTQLRPTRTAFTSAATALGQKPPIA
ncbi:MAG: hypothetical protein EAZ34_02505 [Polaromonas sp.]|nr:MAG: hypothetical protein EAZ34_02505 [Polaromonas sp.]